jgi:hypothetical protein
MRIDMSVSCFGVMFGNLFSMQTIALFCKKYRGRGYSRIRRKTYAQFNRLADAAAPYWWFNKAGPSGRRLDWTAGFSLHPMTNPNRTTLDGDTHRVLTHNYLRICPGCNQGIFVCVGWYNGAAGQEGTMRTIITLLGGMLAFGPLALAQTDMMCPALVEAAYAAAALECEQVAPGTACYGSRPLTVTALGSGNFTRPGHRIGGVQSLESGPMDAASGEWGVAILNVPANAPDQALTMIVLGAVTLADTSGADAPVSTVPVRVTFSGGANLRARPAEDAALVAPLVVGQIIPALGRLADDSWLRLFLDDGRSGWVRVDLVTVTGDLDWLPVVTAASQPPESLYSPLQAFDLISAADDAPCSDAPDSGLLLQAAQPVNLRVNGVDLEMDGTVYLQAPRELIVNVLEGTARVASGGETQTTQAGNRIRVRYDAAEQALTTPRPPEPYSYVRLRPLPLNLLPREIEEPAFNLLGIVTPAAPDQPLLDGITASHACTVAAVNEVRLRRGPGRDYPIQGALYAGESARPDARAAGTDGILWWRLTGGVWVRSDVVLAAGTCGDLPLVEPTPSPTPTPADG